MKKLVIDANNIASIAYHQARKILIRDIKQKFDKNSIEVIQNYTEKVFLGLIVYIFFNIFHKYLRENKGYQVHVIWDGRNGSAWRKDHNEEYKANRDHSKDEYYDYFIESLHSEKEILEGYPIIQMGFDKAEADDIIYNICEMFQNDEIKVITGDGDLLQLIQKFNNVKVWHPKKKKYVDPPEYDVVLFKSIAGDNSDNIMGLYKFGEKKALRAINENLVNLSEEQRKQVAHNKIIIDLALNPYAKKNKSMVIDELRKSKIKLDPKYVQKLYFKYRLVNYLKKWDSIVELLRQLEKESTNGGKKES
jgi:5'-3' exonuclease